MQSVEDVDKREEQLRDMTEIYDAVKNDVLPQLRKALIVIRAYEPKKTDQEILDLAIKNPIELTLEEILFSTSLTNNLNEKIKILNAAIELHDDWRVYNNLACAYIQQKKLDEAIKYLNKAAKIAKNPKNDILINKGIVHARKGELDKAQKLFNQGNASELNQAILDIRKGEYKKATRYFKNNTSHNATLAKLLNGNNNASCSEETAQCFYLNAISSARRGDNNATINYLSKAISINISYKNEAKIDLEFINLRDNESFIALTNN